MSLTKKLLLGFVMVAGFTFWQAVSKKVDSGAPAEPHKAAEPLAPTLAPKVAATPPKPATSQTTPTPEPTATKRADPITKDTSFVVEYLAEQASRFADGRRLTFADDYEPQVNRLAYVDYLKLIQTIGDGALVETPDGTTLFLLGVYTGDIETGGGWIPEKALLIGPVISYKTVLGASRNVLTATLVDLQKILAE